MDATDPEGLEVFVDDFGGGAAGELEPAVVEEDDGAVGRGGAGELRSAVEDEMGVGRGDRHRACGGGSSDEFGSEEL